MSEEIEWTNPKLEVERRTDIWKTQILNIAKEALILVKQGVKEDE